MENTVKLYAEKVNNRGLCATVQAELLQYRLLGGLAVRKTMGLLTLFVLCNAEEVEPSPRIHFSKESFMEAKLHTTNKDKKKRAPLETKMFTEANQKRTIENSGLLFHT